MYFLLTSLLLINFYGRAYACSDLEFTNAYYAKMIQTQKVRLDIFKNLLKNKETTCKEDQIKISSLKAKIALGTSCGALNETAQMNENLVILNESCSKYISEVNDALDYLNVFYVSPIEERMGWVFNNYKDLSLVREFCDDLLKENANLLKDAQLLLSQTKSAIASVKSDLADYKSFGMQISAMKNNLIVAANNCGNGGAIATQLVKESLNNNQMPSAINRNESGISVNTKNEESTKKNRGISSLTNSTNIALFSSSQTPGDLEKKIKRESEITKDLKNQLPTTIGIGENPSATNFENKLNQGLSIMGKKEKKPDSFPISGAQEIFEAAETAAAGAVGFSIQGGNALGIDIAEKSDINLFDRIHSRMKHFTNFNANSF